MKKWKERWNKLLPYEKKFDVAALVLACAALAVFGFWVLDKVGVLPAPFDLFIIIHGLMAFALACLVVVLWRTKRSEAKGGIAWAIICAIAAIVKIVKLFI